LALAIYAGGRISQQAHRQNFQNHKIAFKIEEENNLTTLFNNMSELNAYLEKIEGRIKTLEEENERLRAIQPARESVDGNGIARYVSRALPRTNLLSPSFFKRSFTVWGHFS
jgi:hypothetical protein